MQERKYIFILVAIFFWAHTTIGFYREIIVSPAYAERMGIEILFEEIKSEKFGECLSITVMVNEGEGIIHLGGATVELNPEGNDYLSVPVQTEKEGTRTFIRYVCVSTQQLNNLRVILDDAMEALLNIASEVSYHQDNGYEFKRVDLCWQFQGEPEVFLLAHRFIKHPEIHKTKAFFEDESVNWWGREMKIRIYDKLRQKTKGEISGQVIRVEVELRHKKLRRLFCGDKSVPLTYIQIDRAYQIFREKNPPISAKIANQNHWDRQFNGSGRKK